MTNEVKFDIKVSGGSLVKLFYGASAYHTHGAYVFFEEVEAPTSLFKQLLSMSNLENEKNLTRIEVPKKKVDNNHRNFSNEEVVAYTIYSNEEDLNGNKSFVQISYNYSKNDWSIEDYKLLNESGDTEGFEDVKAYDNREKYVSKKFRPVVVVFSSKASYITAQNGSKICGKEQSTNIFRPES
ncbi:hypothetical protein BN7_2773 [Wickerhamomyces ciferrii]|uniref:Uncharacterized protein n=1 Tax=Wickerhamomyces ciferrii (strain ATCC 14091 / BCRC 22168 / CBS 111 / JCM 3599 / NBRC 0793 / NRRL Y-1031 F-60-10) TaxID=1206466 RepID=K0KJV9_WICCF|nr:uncharacterized protein BN7_2773 [Wickerhamomyces ciferrii]CCH43226.1 hypothetical protein BN7_2773 [Wickerhamomyces ciferrii]